MGDPVTGSPHCQARTTYTLTGCLVFVVLSWGVEVAEETISSISVASLSCQNPFKKKKTKWLRKPSFYDFITAPSKAEKREDPEEEGERESDRGESVGTQALRHWLPRIRGGNVST